jgi:putative SOS response-associated peptidase YedK
MPVIVNDGQVSMVLMAWGLLPHWANSLQGSNRPINARAETLTEKPLFRGLLKQHRCLIPASGFFEWKRAGSRRQPYYFHLNESPLFAFAGLYDVWHGADGKAYPTYTIITTEANDLVSPIHNRMPVILRPEDEGRWLASTPPAPDEVQAILRAYPSEAMEAYPVSPRVNSPAEDDERLIARVL